MKIDKRLKWAFRAAPGLHATENRRPPRGSKRRAPETRSHKRKVYVDHTPKITPAAQTAEENRLIDQFIKTRELAEPAVKPDRITSAHSPDKKTTGQIREQ